MKIGFIGFGEVASILSKKLLSKNTSFENIEILSSTEDRSEKTKKLCENSSITILDTFEEVAKFSDILISVTSPHDAIKIAKEYATITNNLFLDLNNVSPKTTIGINNLKNNSKFVKGAIIGKISSEDYVIYLSGKYAKDLEFLNDFGLNIKYIGKKVEDSSYIKILRSIYTKGVTAILYELFNISEELNLTNEVFEALNYTERENFESKSMSRINSLINSHERKYEEMDEILEFLKSLKNLESLEFSDDFSKNNFDFNYKMIKATKDTFKEIK
ncbi:Pyrroline-5-carboxylate reductase [Candidatus Methanobinarius endosymbioticus]|uniref:Pyrroline-5-carboxylate reductase n=1 Tax=Candidatus Methanobinarius endosymbioticus TaxID=2006182 RepID=A0A366MBC2_9EURY|nr:Pyrroline-5-carboxylate reductase [Candidatus Methanobinarius endosymbioticus]